MKMKTKNKNLKLVLGVGLIIVALLAISILFGNKGSNVQKTPASLPDYALKTSEITEAYLFASQDPDALNGVNCYCGCMKGLTDDRLHYRGLIDCYTEINGSFDQHASNCSTCINEALRVKTLISQGKTKDEIKATIDSEYGHPQGGSGCNIVPNSTDGGKVFTIPNSGAGCAVASSTTLI